MESSVEFVAVDNPHASKQLVGEFTEIESGKRSDRPELEKAAASRFTLDGSFANLLIPAKSF